MGSWSWPLPSQLSLQTSCLIAGTSFTLKPPFFRKNPWRSKLGSISLLACNLWSWPDHEGCFLSCHPCTLWRQQSTETRRHGPQQYYFECAGIPQLRESPILPENHCIQTSFPEVLSFPDLENVSLCRWLHIWLSIKVSDFVFSYFEAWYA